jgi:hypothetical protein
MVVMKDSISWGITLCSLVKVNSLFRGIPYIASVFRLKETGQARQKLEADSLLTL